MNKRITKLLSVFVIAGAISAGAAFAVTGCNNKPDDPGKQEQTDGVTSVTVKAAGNATTVANGGTLQMSADVVVTGSAAKTVTWSIKDGAEATGATINAEGLLSAGTVAGDVTVVATSTVDNTKKGELKITVQPAQAQPTVTGVTVTAAGDATSMNTGATLQLSATVAGENSPSQEVTWSIDSTTSEGASVSDTGLLTAGTTAGQVVVKATSKADTTKSNTITIEVAVVNAVTGVTVTAGTVVKETKSISLTATVAGTGEYSQEVTWEITEGGDCATLEGATLTGVKEGTVKVQATSVTDTTVKSEPYSITVAPLVITEIGTKAEFLAFRGAEATSDIYKLTADIDLTGEALEASINIIGDGVVFDGQGHTIKNAVYKDAAAKTGILCASVNGGTVTNVKFLSCAISTANESAGIVAGLAENKSTFTKIEFNSCSASTENNYVGLVFARNGSGNGDITIEEITAKNGCITSCAQYGGLLMGDMQTSSKVTFKNLDVAGEFANSSANGSFIAGRTRGGEVSVENAVISAVMPSATSIGIFSGNGSLTKLTIKNVLIVSTNKPDIYQSNKAPKAKDITNLVTVTGVTVNETTATDGANTPAYLKDTLGFDFTADTGIWMTEGENDAKYRLRASSTNVKSPDAVISSVKVSANNVKTRFKKGEEFTSTGLSVMGAYSDGVQLVLNPTEGYTIDSTAFDGNTKGEYTITIKSVENAEITGTYTVSVVEETGFEVIDNHMNHVYLVGDQLDVQNLVVKSIWSDGIKEKLAAADYTIDKASYNMGTAGTYDVSITHGTYAAKTVKINVLNSVPAPVDGKVYVNVSETHDGASGALVNGVETFNTVKDAINFLETVGYAKDVVKVVRVGQGTYVDKITTDLDNLVLIGEGTDKSVLTYSAVESTIDPVSGAAYGLKCATLHVNGEGFRAYNIAIRNDFDYKNDNKKEASPQGLALTINGDQAVLENCYLYGNQDTLYLKSGRAYFKNTAIDGNIDFIFGEANGLAYFDGCTIKAINKSNGQEKNNGYVTAMKADETNKPDYGYIFNKCTFTDDGTLLDGSMSLGRPWGAKATVAYIECSFTKAYSTLAYDGSAKSRWYDMSGNKPQDADFVEYKSTGEGAITAEVAGGRILKDTEAVNYTKANIFAAKNGLCTWTEAWDCDAALTALQALAGATVAPTEIYVSATAISVEAGKKADLYIGVAPWNANDKTVTVTVADETVAKWSMGKVEGLKAGTTTITVSREGMTSKTVSITVTPAVGKTYTYTQGGTNGEEWVTNATGTNTSTDAVPVTGLKIINGTDTFKLVASGKKATIQMTGFTTGTSKAQPYVTVTIKDAGGNVLGTLTGTTTADKKNGAFTFTADGIFENATQFASIEFTCNTANKHFSITSVTIAVE